MAKDLSALLDLGVKPEIIERLKGNWVGNMDELYSRMLASKFSEDEEVVRAMENELGLKNGGLDNFMDSMKKYVSPSVVDAKKPKEYKLGAIIKERKLGAIIDGLDDYGRKNGSYR